MTQKELAVKCLEQLDIYKPFIMEFKSDAPVACFFEYFTGYYAHQEEVLWNKIKAVEAEYGVLVYAITHETTKIGETWSMLCVPKDAQYLEDIISKADQPRYFYTFAYVWNASYPECSEFGDITVQSLLGGIQRIY